VKRRAALLLLLLLPLLGAFFLNRHWRTPYRGWRGPSATVEIPRGAPAGRAVELLEEAGVVRSAVLTKAAYALLRRGLVVQAGRHTFRRPLTPLEALDELGRPTAAPSVRFTLPEGLRLEETAALLDREGICGAAEWLALVRDPSPMLDLDPRARDLEGYLWPETYFLPAHPAPGDVLARMLRAFRAFWTPERRELLQTRGLSLRQAVILASIVEKETGKAEERARVAGVFFNRLRLGMPLQSDPTVVYALVLEGRWDGRLRRRDLEMDHPYNTYTRPGLPPGPICSPGEAALEAVLHPEAHDYLYFVADGTGGHSFSRTLKEHNREVRRYRRRKEN